MLIIIGLMAQRYIIINKVSKYLWLNKVNVHANDGNLLQMV
jgi:hypothetical protein